MTTGALNGHAFPFQTNPHVPSVPLLGDLHTEPSIKSMATMERGIVLLSCHIMSLL